MNPPDALLVFNPLSTPSPHKYCTANVSKSFKLTAPSLFASSTFEYSLISFDVGLNAKIVTKTFYEFWENHMSLALMNLAHKIEGFHHQSLYV